MRWFVLALCGCGRIAFDPSGGGASDATSGDATSGDASIGDPDGASALAPIAWWKLDETLGMVANDAVGGLNGQLAAGSTNPPAWTGVAHTGGSAVAFTGDGDRIEIGTPAALANLPAVSVSAWIRPTDVTDAGNGKCIFDKGSPTAGYAFGVGQVGDGSIAFEARFGAAYTRHCSAPGVIVTNAWQHVVTTWTGSNLASSIHIYVNGAEVSDATMVTAPGGVRPDDSAVDAAINCYGATGMPGIIDDVQIYDRILTPAEVAQLYGS